MTFSYNSERLYDLAKKFHTLTGIKTVIYDVNFRQIAAFPEKECPFCEAMQRNMAFADMCEKCVEEGVIPCKRDNAINIYKCHAGLFEITSPIRINGVIFGYLTIGQIIEEGDRIHKRGEILSYAARFTYEDVSPLFDALITKSRAQIEAAAKIMEACVAYILMSNIVFENKGDIILRINDFIEKNISGDLSVDALCREFNISRNALYRLSKEFFGVPIARFIKAKRMDVAARLIEAGGSVSEAAKQVGFYDYNYFSKAFKSVKGVSPNKYKNA